MTTRRRVLTILAGAAVLPVLGARASTFVSEWNGIALGAKARIILAHPDADRLIASAVDEIHRLEGIFSLYQKGSELSRLNRDGVLTNPSFEMIELLSICSNLNARTNGAFDPTVQALWSLYAQAGSQGYTPSADNISLALQSTGWSHVIYSGTEVWFAKDGVALTLNGIAQGYIADRVTKLFRENGVNNVLINTGEISAMGLAPDGDSWKVKLGNVEGTSVSLNNTSIATSAPLGTTFDTNGIVGHILDPRTGFPGRNWPQVSVISTSAAIADGLSTAFILMDEAEITSVKGSDEVYLR